jgi:hypothetical protein
MTLTGHPLERAIWATAARLSSDAYGTRDLSYPIGAQRTSRGEATAVFYCPCWAGWDQQLPMLQHQA